MHASGLTSWGASLALAALLASTRSAPAASPTPITLPGGARVTRVDFERHVMGLLGRMGCNSGSCHGSFQGKGGLRLSLFGYDPAWDFQALTRDNNGRRIDRTDPDRSLVLLKATGQVPHEGKTRFGKDSWPYRTLRAWIAAGAPWQPGSGTVKSVRIGPPEVSFPRLGATAQLRVEATFTDGAQEDVTALCDFRTNDEAVAEVTPLGALKSVKPGDTAIVVSYRGSVMPVRVMVPATLPPGARYPNVEAVNYIDREVLAKLRRLNMVPAELATDSEFLRRVTLDTIGTLPTAKEVREFLADKRPDKRERKIDELLAHPMHAALWATRFCDITGNNTDALEQPQQLKPRLSQMWHDWFRKRVEKKEPYDQIVKNVLCATSREGDTPEEFVKKYRGILEAAQKGFETPYAERKTLDLFWRRQQRVTPDAWGEKTAVAFMGVRLECAQCHKHPFDRWTQEDYWTYANIFSPVTFGVSPEARSALTRGSNEQQQIRQAIQQLNREQDAKQKANEELVKKELAEKRKEVEEKFAALEEKDEEGLKKALQALEREAADRRRKLQNELVRDVQQRRRELQRKQQRALPQLREVFVAARPVAFRAPPGAPQVRTARTLGGPEIPLGSGKDPREALFEWMTQPDHPFFARSFVNRVWGHYFGRGIVDPVDDFSLANPPSNEKLLDALAHDFIANKYDIRQLEKRILLSRTYQQSSTPNATNKFDRNNFARSYVRPLMAEVVVDTLNAALGVTERWGPLDAKPGARAIEVGASRVQNPSVAYAFRVFGRPPRSAACDCDRSMEPGLPQKLFLLADVNLQQKLKAPQNRITDILKEKADDNEAFDELFLATLSRFPTAAERKQFAEYRDGKKAPAAAGGVRRAVFTDTLWALINTTEFIFNH
jgi:hypothetical protein